MDDREEEGLRILRKCAAEATPEQYFEGMYRAVRPREPLHQELAENNALNRKSVLERCLTFRAWASQLLSLRGRKQMSGAVTKLEEDVRVLRKNLEMFENYISEIKAYSSSPSNGNCEKLILQKIAAQRNELESVAAEIERVKLHLCGIR